MRVGYNPQSMLTSATLCSNKTSAAYVNSALFCRLCLQKSHPQAQCPFIPIYRRQSFAAEQKNLDEAAIPTAEMVCNLANKRAGPRTLENAHATSARAKLAKLAYAIGERTVEKLEVENVQTVSSATNDCGQRASFKLKRFVLRKLRNRTIPRCTRPRMK